MLTVKEVLQTLKEKYGYELDPDYKKAENKIRDWVRRGLIDGPVRRVGVEGTGGRQGLYSDDLPICLAILYNLKEKHKKSLETIKGIREFVEKSLTEKVIPFNVTIGYFIENLALLRLYYFYYVKYIQEINDPFYLTLDIIRDKNENLSISYQTEKATENRCSVRFVFRDSDEKMVINIINDDPINQDKEAI